MQVPTEIHTIETRSVGQSATVFINFLSSFCIAQAFLSMMCRLEVIFSQDVLPLHPDEINCNLLCACEAGAP